MAIHWNIVEAIGTWFSGIITAGTLLFMYVQYRNDKKERLKKEELDKEFELMKETISGFNVEDCTQYFKEFNDNPESVATFTSNLRNTSSNITAFSEKDRVRGVHLLTLYNRSTALQCVEIYNKIHKNDLP